jgi:hypothetical protein
VTLALNRECVLLKSGRGLERLPLHLQKALSSSATTAYCKLTVTRCHTLGVTVTYPSAAYTVFRTPSGCDRDGWTVARAQAALSEQLAGVRAGTWKAAEPVAAGETDDPTFRVFASSWLEDNMLEWRTSTISDIKWRLRSHLLPHVGDRRLSTFDIPTITAVKTALLRESRRIADQLERDVVERDDRNMPLRPLSHESINKCLALLARILDDAVERGYMSDNPARRVRRLRHHRPRRPVLEPHQVNAMLEAADRLDRKEAGITAPVLAVVSCVHAV